MVNLGPDSFAYPCFIGYLNLSGIQVMNICAIIKWPIIQMVF